ncbi:MAG: flavodoxin [Methanosarcinaceae archaeon]|jgi:flavodoxin I|nr:flavodoxin [Methanosarcinaceae archaeon]
MTKAIIMYASTSGNTEELSKGVANGLKSAAEITVENIVNTDINTLSNYDLLVFGCSTHGDGALQNDFIEFYEKMTEDLFKGKKVAVFGPGNSERHPNTFCNAIATIETKLKECGAELVAEGFKVDGAIDPVMNDAKEWGKKVITAI